MTKRWLSLTLAGTALVVFLMAGCHTTDRADRNSAEKGSPTASKAGNAISDDWITLKTKLALVADKRTSGFDTDVDSRMGNITLSGKVDTLEAKTAATEVAKKIEGVREVDNQLQVVPDVRRKEVAAADSKIEDGIKNTVKSDPKLKDTSLSAKSNNGVVTLTGSVDTNKQLLNAAQAISKVPGVKSVDTTQVAVKNAAMS